MRHAIAGLVLFLAAVAMCQESSPRSDGPPLELVLTPVRVKYCSEFFGYTAQFHLHTALINKSDQNLIVERSGGWVVRELVSDNKEKARVGIYRLDMQPHYVTSGERDTVDRQSTTSPASVVLHPSEKVEESAQAAISVSVGSSSEVGLVSPGRYFLQLEMPTWQGSKEQGERRRIQWKAQGVVFLGPVVSEPLEVELPEHPHAESCECKKVLNAGQWVLKCPE